MDGWDGDLKGKARGKAESVVEDAHGTITLQVRGGQITARGEI